MKPALRRRLFVVSVLFAALFLAWLRPGVERSPWAQLRLFSAGARVENFRHMERVFPARELAPSTHPHAFPQAPRPLPEHYTFEGQTHVVGDFLARSQTTGLLVLKDGAIVHEEYRLGANPDSRFTSWSVAKSVVATLVGIALKDGAIRSLDDKVTVYVPEYAGTAWEKASIRDLLRMASGVAFDERYDTQFSDIQRVMQLAFVFGRPIDESVRRIGLRPPEGPPGTRMHYISIDTQVLANVLRHATGRRLVDYAHEKLWEPLGMQDAALWNLDGDAARGGTEIAYCCLNTTLRDYAKIGQLYLQQGAWDGRQLLPADWVRESTRRSEPWLQPGVATPARGYGYQWWVPPQADGEYFANGIWGQVIWVDEKRKVVIVKTSADPAFEAHVPEMIAALRGIARGYDPVPSGPSVP